MVLAFEFHGLYLPTPASAYWTGGAVIAIVIILGLLAVGLYLVVKHRSGTYAASHERERRSAELRARRSAKARARRLRTEGRAAARSGKRPADARRADDEAPERRRAAASSPGGERT